MKHRVAGRAGGAPRRSRGWRCAPARELVSSRHAESAEAGEGRRAGGRRGDAAAPADRDVPKPLLPMVDRPFLAPRAGPPGAHGVHEVVLSSPYLEAVFDAFLDERQRRPADHVDHRGARRSGPAARSRTPLDRPRRDVPGAERRHPHRPRPDRAARVPPRARRRRHDHARAGGRRPAVRTGRRSTPTAACCEFREKPAGPDPAARSTPGPTCSSPSALRGVSARPTSVSIETRGVPRADRVGAAACTGSSSDAYWMDLGTPEKIHDGAEIQHHRRCQRDGLRHFVEHDVAIGRSAGWINRRTTANARLIVGIKAALFQPMTHGGVECAIRVGGDSESELQRFE